MMTVTRSDPPFVGILWILAFGLLTCVTATAQQNPEAEPLYSAADLEELVGPVALYPDELLAILLPASAYPLQLVQAKRFLQDHEQDSDLEPADNWDDAVVALLNYPEIVDFMNDDLDWTWTLGEAVITQQPEIMTAIQDFRERAYTAGNLNSDDRQTVSRVDGVIKIERVEPEVIYVPYYEPERVVVYQSVPVYHYYPLARPVYYYPYPTHYRFASEFFWGVTTAYVFGWLTDGLYAHHYGHVSHPYYGHTYYRQNYRRHHIYTGRDRYRYPNHYTSHGRIWRTDYRRSARPRHIDAAGTHVVRTHVARTHMTGKSMARVNAPGKNATRRAQPTVASNFRNSRTRRQTSGQRTASIRAPAQRTVTRRTTTQSRDRTVASVTHRTVDRTTGRNAGQRSTLARSDTRVARAERSSRSQGAARKNRQRVAATTQKPVDRSPGPQSKNRQAPERSGNGLRSSDVKSVPNTHHSSRGKSGRAESSRSGQPTSTRSRRG